MYRHLITTDPQVMMGKPVIAGTRITVEHILEELAAGSTVDELLEAHPRLTREAIQAALAYALDLLRTKRGIPMADTTLPTNEAPITAPTSMTEETTEQAPTLEDLALEEEIEEELIIEDFTIDGICGVY